MIVTVDPDYIQDSYVVINDIYYKVETPLKAIDIAFKLTFALDTKYPLECAREWFFLQRAIYKISSTNDKNIADATVLSLIEQYIKFKID